MPTQTDLHLILSDALQTDQLSLEHDTVVVNADFTRRVGEALCASAATTPYGAVGAANLSARS